MNNSLHPNCIKAAIGIVGIGIIAVIVVAIVKELNNEILSKYWLLVPPILIAFGFSIFYEKLKKIAEFIFSIASALGALTLCIDTLANTQNDLFPY
ncbi:hypothetical protein HRJ04_001881, partial [Escherichia coli]|nr:hypothetical protein [Escherichia coli]